MDQPALFLSYNSVDRPSVVAVQKLLAALGITTFLDRDQLVPGRPWPTALEEGLRAVRAVAVFIGRELGGWQKREMWFALDRQVREEKQGHPFPVIPVLLAGADLTPSFLFTNTWIDLRGGLDTVAVAEPLDAFEHAINATTRAQPAPAERAAALCPYRGLEAFREEHAAFFAGRRAFASELFNCTVGKELVAVVGPSGSGKSSVVQAGLVPLLRRQLPPAVTWDVVTFTPGTDPFLRLASALAPLLEQDLSETDRLTEAHKLGKRLADDEIRLESVIDRVIEKSNGTGRLLVVADQFEELFTLTPEPNRRPFARALVQALGKARFTLLVTLRADFYSQIITLDRELSDRLAPAQVNIGALTRDELQESITAPAKLVGLEFEPGLVDRILHDVGSEPGNLPLLEFALTGLWSKRQNRTLTNAAYDEIGGVTGALAQRAEAVFAQFAPEEQTAARRLLSRLVRVARPEEGAEDTRQRIELQATDTLAEKVAQALAGPDVRLLVMGRPEGEEQSGNQTVEVAHEALIRNWGRLRGWLNQDREFLLWRQRLQIQVEQWEQHERDSSYLLRGISLVEAERWLVGRPQDLATSEKQFVSEGVALREREDEAEQQRRKAEIENANRLKETAEARAAAEQLARELAEARESAERAARTEVQRRLEDRARAVRMSRLLTIFLGVACLAAIIAAILTYRQGRISFSKQLAAQSLANREKHLDLALLLALQAMRVARNVDTRTAMLAGMLEHPSLTAYLREHTSEAWALSLDQTGHLLASGHFDGSVELWDLTSRSRLPVPELSSSSVTSIAISADGMILAAGTSGEINVLNRRRRAWDGPYPTGITNGVTRNVSALALSPDGTEMSSAFCFQENEIEEPDSRCVSTEVDIWQIGRTVPQRTLKLDGPEIRALAFQPDGALVIANPAGLFIWDFERRNHPMKFEALNGATPLYVAMSKSGQPIACGTRNEDILCWDVTRKNVITEFTSAHNGPITAIAACLDCHILASGASDRTLLLWNTGQDQRIGRTIKVMNTKFTAGIAIINDERLVAGSDGQGVLVDLKSGSQTSLAGTGPLTRGIAVSPDGSEVALAQDRAVALWRLSDPPALERLLPIDGGFSWRVAFRNDGKVLASGSDNGKVYRWDLANGFQSLPSFVIKSDSGYDEPVYTVAFAPHGGALAAGGPTGISIFDANTGRLLRSKKMSNTVEQLAFTPDGRSLAFAILGGQVGSIDLDLKAMQYPLTSPEEFGGALQYSSDGSLLVWICEDGSTKIWDVRENRLLGTLPAGEPGVDGGIALSNDTRLLAVSGPGGSVVVWNLDESLWASQACAIAGRDLTQAEWDQFVGGRKEALCGDSGRPSSN